MTRSLLCSVASWCARRCCRSPVSVRGGCMGQAFTVRLHTHRPPASPTRPKSAPPKRHKEARAGYPNRVRAGERNVAAGILQVASPRSLKPFDLSDRDVSTPIAVPPSGWNTSQASCQFEKPHWRRWIGRVSVDQCGFSRTSVDFHALAGMCRAGRECNCTRFQAWQGTCRGTRGHRTRPALSRVAWSENQAVVLRIDGALQDLSRQRAGWRPRDGVPR